MPDPTAELTIPIGRYRAWPTAALRSAGFPVDLLDLLAIDGPPDQTDAAGCRAHYETARAQVRERLRALARDPRFAEAVLLQNPSAYRTAVRPFAREEGRADKRTRQRELLVASYLQRYAAKNESIGFFGPIGYVDLTNDGPTLEVRPGTTVESHLRVRFEAWGIDALAEAIDRSVMDRSDVAPLLSPYLRVGEASLSIPGGPTIPLDAWHAQLLRRCDGTRTAADLAGEAAAEAAGPSVEEALAAIERAAMLGAVQWKLAVPLQLSPEADLRARLGLIRDEALRASSLARLDAMDAARADIERSHGDADAVDRALAACDDAFIQATRASATRKDGATYAARTLVYADARRDVQARMGRAVFDAIEPALTLVLDAASWSCDELTSRFDDALLELHGELEPKHGRVVPAPIFLQALQTKYGLAAEVPFIRDVHAEVERRWRQALGPGVTGDAPVHLAARDLAERFGELFPRRCPAPAWRYLSPDLIVAAPSVEDVQAGRFSVVLGELHTQNTLAASLFVEQHPDRGRLNTLMRLDETVATAAAVVPKELSGIRTMVTLTSPRQWHYALVPGPIARPRETTLRLGDLDVRREGEGLVVEGAGGTTLSAGTFFASQLHFRGGGTFKPGALEGQRSPRVVVDRLVVMRATWRFDAATMVFSHSDDAFRRFEEAAAFRAEAELPRRCFFRTPLERKPIYVDWDSPVLVDLVAKLVRAAAMQGAVVGFTEMLPAPDDCWLVDAQGRRYTSEIRAVVVRPGAAED